MTDWDDDYQAEARRLGNERARRQSDRLTPGVTRAATVMHGSSGFRERIHASTHAQPDPADILDDHPHLLRVTIRIAPLEPTIT